MTLLLRQLKAATIPMIPFRSQPVPASPKHKNAASFSNAAFMNYSASPLEVELPAKLNPSRQVRACHLSETRIVDA